MNYDPAADASAGYSDAVRALRLLMLIRGERWPVPADDLEFDLVLAAVLSRLPTTTKDS